MSNFKVRCVSGYTGHFTKGKIYDVINGCVTCDNNVVWKENASVDYMNDTFVSQFELVVEPKYPLGTKLKIINAGSGAMGCNGCVAIVTDKTASNGWSRSKPDNGTEIFNVEILESLNLGWSKVGAIWGVREDGEYEVLDKTIVLTDKKEENVRFKREDLRMFDVVEWRNGWLMLVIVHGGKFYFSGLTVAEHSSFEWYDDSLKNKVSREYEPVKVYRPNDESSLRNLIVDKDLGGYELLWEEKQELELTLDEIAEKFGVKVENLKIKK